MKQKQSPKKTFSNLKYQGGDKFKNRFNKPDLRMAMTARPRCLGGHN